MIKQLPRRSAGFPWMHAAVGTLALMAGASHAQSLYGINPPPAPAVGSAGITSAALNVARPSTTPCVVDLYDSAAFVGATPFAFSYTPPVDCPAPWAQVVLETDFDQIAGDQAATAAQLFIGGVNVFSGLVPVGNAGAENSWHAERDLSDYAAVFKSAQAGVTLLPTDPAATALVSGSARLVFYPSSNPSQTAVLSPLQVPNMVFPLNAASAPAVLASASDSLSASVTLPGNTVFVYLDVTVQPQAGEDYWYTCVPDDIAATLQTCGGTAFREVQISVDGTPAAAMPMIPYIGPGDYSSSLWQPIASASMLNAQPYRVDLSPFAGVLNDGNPHTISLGVANARSQYLASASLLVDTDPVLKHTSGGVSSNNLVFEISPKVGSHASASRKGSSRYKVSLTASRSYAITGSISSSLGGLSLKTAQSMNFSNQQRITTASTGNNSQIQQSTAVTDTSSITPTTQPTKAITITTYTVMPVTVAITTPSAWAVQQSLSTTYTYAVAGVPVFASSTLDAVTPAVGKSGTSSNESYIYADLIGNCYIRSINASQNLISGVTTTTSGCTIPSGSGNHSGN